MAAPLIGVTTYGKGEDGQYRLPAQYVQSVRRAKGVPLLMPPGEPHALELLDRLDGLILTGGGDIDPTHYGGSTHESIYNIDPERDAGEIAMAKKAVETGLPTLGICRGTQVINVALGGTLIAHLPDVVGEVIGHREVPRKPTRHAVFVEPGCKLAAIVGKHRIEPVSWHHQAILHPAPNLKVIAQAPDGTVEAVELPDHPWLMAVQWHPELSAADDPGQQRLFDTFVEAAASRRQ